MADEKENPNPQPQAPAPQMPLNAQQIIAAQQAAIAEQVAAARARDRAMFGPATADTPQAPVMGNPVFAQGAQAQQAAQAASQGQQGFNLPQGMTPQQIAQGVGTGRAAPAVPQGFAQQSQQKEPAKTKVNWHPLRNSKLIIELDDALLANLPDSIEQESDPQAKVVAVLLSEVLSLRSRVEFLEQGGGGMQAGALEDIISRIRMLEATLFEQTQALKQKAQAFREAALEQEEKKKSE